MSNIEKESFGRGIKRRMGACFSSAFGASNEKTEKVEESASLNRAKVLADIPFFQMHSQRQLELLAEELEEVHFEEGAQLVTEGEVEHAFYLLKDPTEDNKKLWVSSTKSSRNASCFGEMSLRYNNVKSRVTVRVAKPVTLLTIPISKYQNIIVSQAKDEEGRFMKFLRNVKLLENLTEEQLAALGRSVREEKFRNDQMIIKQGTKGSTFYFIENGTVKCMQHTKKGTNEVVNEVNRYSAGDYFGEGALLQDVPRNADVIAVGNVTCLTLTRDDFNEILGCLQEILDHNFKARVLKGVELLAKLTDTERSELADLLVEETFEPGQTIITQGDHGNKFYLIKHGEVRFTRVGSTDLPNENEDEGSESQRMSGLSQSAETEIGRLFKGQYFGEGALLTNEPRRASAYAVDKVVLLSLNQESFNRVFNQTMHETLNKNFEKRRGPTSNNIEFSDLEQIKVLGAGSFGQVWLVNHKVTGMTYALKSMEKVRVIKMKQEEHVQNERRILASISHPFIVNLRQTYECPEYVFVLLEAVMGGELYAYTRSVGKINLSDSLFYIAQVVIAFEYLHSKSIIYRDLKPENLLVNTNGYLKFTDFGLAKQLGEGMKTYTLCGTPVYAAPEVYNLSGHGRGADWWTLGVLIHELLSGMTPFDGDAKQIFASMTQYARAYPNIRLPSELSGDIGDLCLKLLNPNKNTRIASGPLGTARDIKIHPVFSGFDWNALVTEEMISPFKPKIQSMYDTGNFYAPHKTSMRINLENLDFDSVKITNDDWSLSE